jgi:preprotein translocase subunit YajC
MASLGLPAAMHALSILAQGDSNSGGGIGQLLVLLLIPVAMYFLLIRPQRKRQKLQASVQSSLGIGDEVITNSGIFGIITGEDGERFWLEIDDDVQIQIAKAAIQGKVKQPGETDKPTKADKSETSDDDDAEATDES